jgi:hypothetical protein
MCEIPAGRNRAGTRCFKYDRAHNLAARDGRRESRALDHRCRRRETNATAAPTNHMVPVASRANRADARFVYEHRSPAIARPLTARRRWRRAGVRLRDKYRVRLPSRVCAARVGGAACGMSHWFSGFVATCRSLLRRNSSQIEICSTSWRSLCARTKIEHVAALGTPERARTYFWMRRVRASQLAARALVRDDRPRRSRVSARQVVTYQRVGDTRGALRHRLTRDSRYTQETSSI